MYIELSNYQKASNLSWDLSASPAIWQFYLDANLGSIPDRSKYLAIIDDLLLDSSK